MNSSLPLLEGVAPGCLWLPKGDWATILDFLQQRFPHVSAAQWLSRLTRGLVVDETGRRIQPDSPYRAGACIFYYRELELEIPVPFVEQILFEDEHLLAVDKPHFLPGLPAGRFLQETLLTRLRNKGQTEELVPLHRLDRETAGVMLFSRNKSTRGQYSLLWQKRQVNKVYEALAPGSPQLDFPLTRRSRLIPGEPFFRMQEIPGTPNTTTCIEVISESKGLTRYRARPLTGRKHQIRVHFAALGIPLRHDKLYPEITPSAADDFSQPLGLLAKSISFRDPLTGQEREFTSGLSL